MGYTINRVSLFALIFAIGILVDDAIVVVENIARHWAMRDGRTRMQAAIEAVAEVGNPTVVATLTVVAALLPMLFVSGLMGPYMAPIPANASAAMLFSFFVAMVVAPWLMLRLRAATHAAARRAGDAAHGEGRLGRLYRAVAAPLLRSRARAWIFLLVGRRRHDRRLRAVLHRGRHGQAAAVRQQVRTGGGAEPARRAAAWKTPSARCSPPPTSRAALPEVRSVQAYAGTAAPFNFNGLVRHYYMRQSPELGDLQINLRRQGRARPRQPRDRARSAPAACTR